MEAAYAPLEVVLKIKPRSSRDSRGRWGLERRAWAGCFSPCAPSPTVPGFEAGAGTDQPNLATPQAGRLPGDAARARAGTPTEPSPFPALAGKSGSADCAPRASPRRGQCCWRSAVDSGTPHPKSQRWHGPRSARAKPGSWTSSRLLHSQPPPRWPRRPVPLARPPTPVPCILTCAAAGEAGLLGKLCGDGWSLRGYSKEQAGTGAGGRQGGPGRGAPGARRSAVAGPG